MNILFEILKGLGYSLVGFLVGYNFAKLRRTTEEIKETIVDDDGNPSVGSVGKSSGTGSPSKGNEGQGIRWLGVVLIMLSLITVAQAAYFSIQSSREAKKNADIAECQAQFNSDFAQVVKIRNAYAEEDRAANLKMWDAFLAPGGTQATRLKAAEEFTDAMHKNEELRKQSPLPNLSDRNCTRN